MSQHPSNIQQCVCCVPGSVLATCGEDGQVKVWSRNGMLRSTLAQADSPVYAVAWGSSADQLLYCAGQHITITSLQSSAKHTSWKAHDAVVLKVDWSPISNLIVSGGEDCKYKVHTSAIHADRLQPCKQQQHIICTSACHQLQCGAESCSFATEPSRCVVTLHTCWLGTHTVQSMDSTLPANDQRWQMAYLSASDLFRLCCCHHRSGTPLVVCCTRAAHLSTASAASVGVPMVLCLLLVHSTHWHSVMQWDGHTPRYDYHPSQQQQLLHILGTTLLLVLLQLVWGMLCLFVS